jgi:hypothetical protein
MTKEKDSGSFNFVVPQIDLALDASDPADMQELSPCGQALAAAVRECRNAPEKEHQTLYRVLVGLPWLTDEVRRNMQHAAGIKPADVARVREERERRALFAAIERHRRAHGFGRGNLARAIEALADKTGKSIETLTVLYRRHHRRTPPMLLRMPPRSQDQGGDDRRGIGENEA